MWLFCHNEIISIIQAQIAQKQNQSDSQTSAKITIDPRNIKNPYQVVYQFGPVVSADLGTIHDGDLQLLESRGLSEDQSKYTVLLIQKYGFKVSDIMTDLDDMYAKNHGSTKRDDRNINLWNGFLMNAYLQGKTNRNELK